MTITELSIKRPTLVVVVFSFLGVLGLFSYNQLKYELLPKITPPWVTITTIYPGASPNEVESGVTKVIEDAVSGVDKVSTVYATSQEGLSLVSIEFDMTADIVTALQDVQRKVNEVESRIADGAKTPVISKFALDELPVLRIGVTANMPSRDFFQFLKDHIQPRLSKLSGVGQITLVGGDEREIKVNIDAQKLRSYGLSLFQVTQLIKTSNLDFPTGKIKHADEQFIVRLAGKYQSTDELRNLVVGQSHQGGDVKLADIAEVEDGRKEYEMLSRINGKTSVGVIVQKQGEANSVEVSRVVRSELAKIESDYADQNVRFDIAQDGSTFTIDAADAVKHDLTLAVILVAIVMLAFLHSIRNSVIVMIAIPASLVSTFIGIYAFGFSLNLMTLLGLSLVIGILVDDSIVVLENIYRHLEHGEQRRDAALKGRNEIGFAALSITMVDVVVFVPLALVSGLIGNIMREFAMVVVFSTLMSLFVSFTITPLLASRFAKLERLTKNTILGRFALWFEVQYNKAVKLYLEVLEWSLHHPWKMIGLAAALFVLALMLPLFRFVGSEFMTQTDRGEFTVTLEAPAGSTLDHTNYLTQQVERFVAGIPEVKKVFTNVGVSTEGLVGQSSNYVSELNITLVPKENRHRSTDEVASAIKRYAREIPGLKVRANPIGIFGTANQAPIALIISGTNYDSVHAVAEKVAEIVRTIPGTADVRLSVEEGKPETRIEVRRDQMADLGLTLGEVGSTLRIAYEGDDESKYRDGSNDYPIRVVLDDFDRSKTSDVGNLTFVNRKGQLVELKQFSRIYQSVGPTKLQRQDRNYAVTVYSQAIGRPSGSIGEDIKSAISGVLPRGTGIKYEGDLKNQTEGFGSLGLAMIAAILFVYMIMVALYDSYIYPFVVLFSIPVAMVGAMLALALTMKSLNIFSILGLIMLVGLVGKNAILLVDRTNQMRRERGLSVMDALREAAQTRFRPIVMTTASMVVGMMPIALSISSGSEWKSGLAWALIGGLISSLLLTLALVPAVYLKVDGWKETLPGLVQEFLRKRFPRRANEPVVVSSVQFKKGD